MDYKVPIEQCDLAMGIVVLGQSDLLLVNPDGNRTQRRPSSREPEKRMSAVLLRANAIISLMCVSIPATANRNGVTRSADASALAVAVLQAPQIDSLFRATRCRVVLVDTAIRGARTSGGLDAMQLPVVGALDSQSVRLLRRNGLTFVAGAFSYRPVPADSARVAVEFIPHARAGENA